MGLFIGAGLLVTLDALQTSRLSLQPPLHRWERGRAAFLVPHICCVPTFEHFAHVRCIKVYAFKEGDLSDIFLRQPRAQTGMEVQQLHRSRGLCKLPVQGWRWPTLG